MAKRKKREPHGLIGKYIAAVREAEEHGHPPPEPPVFFGPGGDEPIEDFVGRVWQQIEGRLLTAEERADVPQRIAEHERKTPKRPGRS